MTTGDLRLAAGNDLRIKAGVVGSSEGALVATAGKDIQVSASEASQRVSSASFTENKGTFSRSSHTRRDDVPPPTCCRAACAGTALHSWRATTSRCRPHS